LLGGEEPKKRPEGHSAADVTDSDQVKKYTAETSAKTFLSMKGDQISLLCWQLRLWFLETSRTLLVTKKCQIPGELTGPEVARFFHKVPGRCPMHCGREGVSLGRGGDRCTNSKQWSR
jgi:hypothetical protein